MNQNLKINKNKLINKIRMRIPKLVEDKIRDYIEYHAKRREESIRYIDFAVKTYKNCKCKHMVFNRHYQRLIQYDKDQDMRYKWFMELKELISKNGDACEYMDNEQYDVNNPLKYRSYGKDHSEFLYSLDTYHMKKITEALRRTIKEFNEVAMRRRTFGIKEWEVIDEMYKGGYMDDSIDFEDTWIYG
ncbi:MAG: hypothetical protein WD512_13365 [Candidatus Paceibacterota bacterium]